MHGSSNSSLMFIRQQYRLNDTESFVASRFPELEVSLRQIMEQLASVPAGPKSEMILSFVKDHSIRSQQVNDHPQLANLISSKTLPLQVMETLFESSRQNNLFRMQLEDYIKTYFISQRL